MTIPIPPHSLAQLLGGVIATNHHTIIIKLGEVFAHYL